jgi:hypothetical protein
MQLPADRFFWAVVDASGMSAHRGGKTFNRLGFLFENVLPVAIEEVHAVYQPVAGEPNNFIACGIMKDRLREIVASAQTELSTLTPASMPEFAGDRAVDPQSLNLLTGDFQPGTVRQLKQQLLLQAVGLIAVITGLLIVGLERRAASLSGQINQAQVRRASLIANTLGDDAHVSATNPQPIDLRFISELRTLRQTRQIPNANDHGSNSAARDATLALAALLQAWPRNLNVLAESLSITPVAITLRGQAPQHADVQALADALSSLEGWRLEQPQVTASGSPQGNVNAVLQWKRMVPSQWGGQGGPS